MPVIDAHLHLGNRPWFDQSAAACGRQNTLSCVRKAMEQNEIAAVVAMGSGEPLTGSRRDGMMDLEGVFSEKEGHETLYTCVGVHFDEFKAHTKQWLEHLRRCVRLPQTVGFKLYPGYQHFYVTDPALEPLYDLAAETGLPVAVHAGDTVSPGGKLKYSHPLAVDEAAVDHPNVKFVICHMGYPWFADAAETAYKNENVWADLSGLAGGQIDPSTFCRQNKALLDYLSMWMQVAGWDKIIYGSDWPLAPVEQYLALMRLIVPEQHWDQVFWQNALRVYHRIRCKAQM